MGDTSLIATPLPDELSGSGKVVLAPRFVERDRDRVGEVDTATVRPHRYTDPIHDGLVIENVLWESDALPAEQKRVAIPILNVGVPGAGLPRESEYAARLNGSQIAVERIVL